MMEGLNVGEIVVLFNEGIEVEVEVDVGSLVWLKAGVELAMMIGIDDTLEFEVRLTDMMDFVVDLELGIIVRIELVGSAIGDEEGVTVGAETVGCSVEIKLAAALLERLFDRAMVGTNVEMIEEFEMEVEFKIKDDDSLKDEVGSRVEVAVCVEESFTIGSKLGIVKGKTFDTSLGDKDRVISGTTVGNTSWLDVGDNVGAVLTYSINA